MADIKESKNFLSLEGLTHYHEKISVKIDKSTFSKDYEELKNINKIEAELEENFFLISDKKYKIKLKGVK